MDESTRPKTRPPRSQQPDEGLERVGRFPELLRAAFAADEEAQPGLVAQLNELLIAMRAPGHEAAEAEVVLTALEAGKLDTLVDLQGRSVRKEAVETLLACGFPHALKVSHEDLSFARQWATKKPSSSWLRWVAAFSVVLGAGAELLMLGDQLGKAEHLVSVLLGAAAAGAAFLFAGSDRPADRQVSFGVALTMIGLAQLVFALALGLPAALSLAGIVTALVIVFAPQYSARADPPKPGDWDYIENRD